MLELFAFHATRHFAIESKALLRTLESPQIASDHGKGRIPVARHIAIGTGVVAHQAKDTAVPTQRESEKGPHAQRLLISAGTRTAPACLSAPLRAVGISLQLDLHPPRSPCSSGQDRRQTAGSRSLTEYVTVIPNVSAKLAELFSLMWVRADVFRLFSLNVGPLSNNLVQKAALFSDNVGPEAPMFSSQTF